MVLQIGDDGTGVWAQLGAKRIRIGFERKHVSRRADDFKFIDGAFGKLGKKNLPNARRTASAHGMDAAVPAIEVTNNADALGARGPNGKVNAANAFEGEEMRAEFLVRVVMASLAHEIQIKLCENTRESVGVVDFERFAVVRAALNLVHRGSRRGRLA